MSRSPASGRLRKVAFSTNLARPLLEEYLARGPTPASIISTVAMEDRFRVNGHALDDIVGFFRRELADRHTSAVSQTSALRRG